MPFVRLRRVSRRFLLVCDTCEAFMATDGTSSATPYHESDPDDVAPHYEWQAILAATATEKRWVNVGAIWLCPRCASSASDQR